MSRKKTSHNKRDRLFSTGAIRNSDEGKPKMSLLPHKEFIRVLMRYREGADISCDHL